MPNKDTLDKFGEFKGENVFQEILGEFGNLKEVLSQDSALQ